MALENKLGKAKAVIAGGLLALAGTASGCFIAQEGKPYRTPSFRTNTLETESTKTGLRAPGYSINEVTIDGRAYCAIEQEDNTVFVPKDNRTETVRGDGRVEVRPNDEVYSFANVVFSEDNKYVVNAGEDQKRILVPVPAANVKVGTVKPQKGRTVVAQSILNLDVERINDHEFYKVNTPQGNIFVLKDSAIPRTTTSRKKGQETQTQHFLEGFAYDLVPVKKEASE